MVIYGLCDSGEPGVIRYVGKAIDPKRRLHTHLTDNEGVTYKENWVRFVLSEGRKVEQVFIAFASTNEGANYLERHYIKLFRELGIVLTNATDGGDGQSHGWQPPEEWRRKKSEMMRNRVITKETRHKLSVAATGVKFSNERRSNISIALKGNGKGKPKSVEHRLKISQQNKGKPRAYMVARNKLPWTAERKAKQSESQQKRWAKQRLDKSLLPEFKEVV